MTSPVLSLVRSMETSPAYAAAMRNEIPFQLADVLVQLPDAAQREVLELVDLGRPLMIARQRARGRIRRLASAAEADAKLRQELLDRREEIDAALERLKPDGAA